jgi:hypothetical protein
VPKARPSPDDRVARLLEGKRHEREQVLVVIDDEDLHSPSSPMGSTTVTACGPRPCAPDALKRAVDDGLHDPEPSPRPRAPALSDERGSANIEPDQTGTPGLFA